MSQDLGLSCLFLTLVKLTTRSNDCGPTQHEMSLDEVQKHSEGAQRKKSRLEDKLADAKDTKDVEYYCDLLKFSAQTLAALEQQETLLLQTQQGGDIRYAAFCRYLCILWSLVMHFTNNHASYVVSSLLSVLPRFLTMPLQAVKCFAASDVHHLIYVIFTYLSYILHMFAAPTKGHGKSFLRCSGDHVLVLDAAVPIALHLSKHHGFRADSISDVHA